MEGPSVTISSSHLFFAAIQLNFNSSLVPCNPSIAVFLNLRTCHFSFREVMGNQVDEGMMERKVTRYYLLYFNKSSSISFPVKSSRLYSWSGMLCCVGEQGSELS